MTKQEFEQSDEPLVFIISINPATGTVLYDAHPYAEIEVRIKDIQRDFPHHITLFTINKSAIMARKRAYGLIEQG